MGNKSDYSEENYKTDSEIWMENSKLQVKCKNTEMSRPPLCQTPVGAKISDTKTPATYSPAHKEKSRKKYVPEDPNSYPRFSDSPSIDYDSSNNSNYKRRRRD